MPRKKQKAGAVDEVVDCPGLPDDIDFDLGDLVAGIVTKPVTWPDDVPILVAEDMVWCWSSADGRRDLGDWLEVVFASDAARDEASAKLREVLSERTKTSVDSVWKFLEAAKAARAPSLLWQARAWNEMLRRLGYSVAGAACAVPRQ
jgi:hypothetical protein